MTTVPHIETAMSWPGFLPENFGQTQDESGREWINRMAEAASRILFEAGLGVSNYIYDGNPKEVLVRVSEEWQADAIFLGARGLHHGNRLSLGTVASAVATRAHCSVDRMQRIDWHPFQGERGERAALSTGGGGLRLTQVNSFTKPVA